MRPRLDQLTNIAIIIFVFGVGGFYLKDRFGPPKAAVAQLNEVKVGDTLPALPGYEWSSTGHTLVLALRYGCHFCEASAPFYRKLADLQKRGDFKNLHIVAAFPDDRDVAQDLMKKEDVDLDVVPAVNFQALKVPGTPTAILADGHGKVIKTWVGKLEGSQEQTLISTLESANK